MKRRDLLSAAPALLASSMIGGLFKDAHAQSAVVKFGQSASLTGAQASYGKDVRDGIAAAFASAAKSDGGKGPRFELVTLDDGGDRERCKQNTKSLIDSGVSALVGYTSGAGAEAALPIIEAARIVLLGTASGNMGIRNKDLGMPFHVRAGYDDEYAKLVAFVKEFGMRRVGYVYLKDTSPANQAAMESALSATGIKPAETIALDRNAKSFDADAEKLLAAKVDCILFTTNSAPIISLTEQLTKRGYAGFYFSSSFAGQPLIDQMATMGRGIIMAQVVPRPRSATLSLVKRCQQDIAALGGSARMGYTSLEGYIVGQVAIEAARAIKGDGVTRTSYKKALTGLNVDLGGYNVNFAGGGHQGSRFSEVVAVDRTGRIIG